jgi:hypothetical protein
MLYRGREKGANNQKKKKNQPPCKPVSPLRNGDNGTEHRSLVRRRSEALGNETCLL